MSESLVDKTIGRIFLQAALDKGTYVNRGEFYTIALPTTEKLHIGLHEVTERLTLNTIMFDTNGLSPHSEQLDAYFGLRILTGCMKDYSDRIQLMVSKDNLDDRFKEAGKTLADILKDYWPKRIEVKIDVKGDKEYQKIIGILLGET